jgi:hypothetical protein
MCAREAIELFVSSGNWREILERTVHAIADRARETYRLVEEAHKVDPRDESGLTAQAKRLRMELLRRRANSSASSGGCFFTADDATRGFTGSAV